MMIRVVSRRLGNMVRGDLGSEMDDFVVEGMKEVACVFVVRYISLHTIGVCTHFCCFSRFMIYTIVVVVSTFYHVAM